MAQNKLPQNRQPEEGPRDPQRKAAFPAPTEKPPGKSRVTVRKGILALADNVAILPSSALADKWE